MQPSPKSSRSNFSSLRRGCVACAALCAAMSAPLRAALDDSPALPTGSATDDLFGGSAIETQANVFTASTQDHGALTVLPGGGFVAVWDSRRQEHGSYAVVAQRFDVFGRPLGGEVPVNLTSRGMQERPAVAASGDCVWFVWQSHGQDGSGAAIVARRFDRELAGGSPEIPVNQMQAGNQRLPSVVSDGHGGAMFVWIDDSTGVSRIMTRIFDEAGEPISDETPASDQQPGACTSASVVRDADGSYLVAWARTDEQGNPNAVVARRIAADGAPAGDEMLLSEMDGRDHVEPSIALKSDGGFVGAWHSSIDGGLAVDVRFFDAKGAPLTQAVTVADPSNGWKSGATVLAAPDDRYLVVYNSDGAGGDGSGSGVMGQLIDGQGRILASPITLNAFTQGIQEITPATGATRVLIDGAGRLAACWNGASVEGDASSVNLTVRLPMDVALTESEPAGERLAYLPAQTDLNTPIPPIWDPNHVKLERLTAGGDGPDFGFEGVTNTGWTPPDPEMAVGPDRILAIVNGEISLFDKSGNNLFRDEIEDSFGFWGEVGATNFVFDPEAVWDPHSQRLFAMACERSSNGRSMFLLAVSKTSSPSTRTDWWKYRLDVTAISDNDIDSPNMAVDADNVLLTADFFGPDKYLLYFIDKNSILSGGTPVTRHELITGASQQSMGIPVMHDVNAPAQYILQSTELTNNNTVIFHAVRDVFGIYSRQTYTLTVPAYTYPNQPPQRGSSSRPFLFEPRFWSCVQMNDSLWAVHHVNSSRARVRWYEFDMRGWPTSGNNPEIAQSGELDYGGTIHTFFPSIGVDAEGNAAITFSRSSPDEYISMSRAVRKFSDAPGTFQPPEFVKESTAAHNSGRWGDYSKTVNDPATLGSFWGHHEFTLDGNWRTWIARYDVGDPPMILVSSRLVAGVRGTLDVTGATPDAQVAFLYSIQGLGSTYIPQLDVTVNINSPVLAGARMADQNGAASLTKQIPSGTTGRRVWLQAAEFQRATNVVETVIE